MLKKSLISLIGIFGLLLTIVSCGSDHKTTQPVDTTPAPASIVYVSATGSDTNAGTVAAPFLTIQKGIDVVNVAPLPAEVRVAAGVYNVTDAIVMSVDGVSLKGGYTADFSGRGFLTADERLNDTYKTLVTYTGTFDGTFNPPTDANPSRAITVSGASVTLATVIEGLTVNSANSNTASSIVISDGAAVTIRYNTMNSAGTAVSAGVFSIASSPTIEYNAVFAGTSYYSLGLADLGGSPMIAHNDITGGSGSYSFPIAMMSSVNATVSNNSVHGAVGTTTAGGIYFQGASGAIINNTVDGGTSDNDSDGIGATDSTSVLISGNTVNGGVAQNIANGLYISGTAAVIVDNDIEAAQGVNGASGVKISDSASTTVSFNTIRGGDISSDGGGDAMSISGALSSSTIVYSNVIIGGSVVGPTANASNIMINNSSPSIYNNTLIGGISTWYTTGISMFGDLAGPSAPKIDNNIIYITNGACIAEWSTDTTPVEVKNNDLYGAGGSVALYIDAATGPIFDIASVEALTDMTVLGNISSPPDFVDVDNADYHLAFYAANINVRGGGLDLSSEVSVSYDRDGAVRTTNTPVGMTNDGAAGWSMGAYEKD